MHERTPRVIRVKILELVLRGRWSEAHQLAAEYNFRFETGRQCRERLPVWMSTARPSHRAGEAA